MATVPVGMIANAMAELTRSNPQKYVPCPLSVCGAMSRGYIGYDLQNALREEMLDRNIDKGVATVLTQSRLRQTTRPLPTRSSRLVRG